MAIPQSRGWRMITTAASTVPDTPSARNGSLRFEIDHTNSDGLTVARIAATRPTVRFAKRMDASPNVSSTVIDAASPLASRIGSNDGPPHIQITSAFQ